MGRALGSMSLDARGAKALNRGRGMLLAALGRSVREYDRHDTRVLTSFPEPRVTTNPYITQLAAALRATPGITIHTFQWSYALFGRYDVVHLHWPETLFSGQVRIKRLVRRLLVALLVVRWKVSRIPVVWTQHNSRPHEDQSLLDRRLQDAVERTVVARIVLTARDATCPTDTHIPHGHYVDWFAQVPNVPPRPGRIILPGRVRRYKNAEGLITAFTGVKRADASLRIVGDCTDPAVAKDIRDAAASDERVSIDLRFAPDNELAKEIKQAQLVVLPYRDMHNSGAALLALSLQRPVLLPDNAANRLLQRESGAAWVLLFDPPLTAVHIEDALQRVTEVEPASPPNLSSRAWDDVGQRHLKVYEGAMMARPRRSTARGGYRVRSR